nr:hypothetical protein [uncultured Duganella sp.]
MLAKHKIYPSPINFERPRGAFHPTLVKSAYPAHRFWPEEPGDENFYGTLSDSSHYREYAWEFLRRNRFFQQQHDCRVDDRPPPLLENQWGFQFHAEWEPSSGLEVNTHYSQPYIYPSEAHSGSQSFLCVRWSFLQHFKDQFRYLAASSPELTSRKLEDGQVTVVFDLLSFAGRSHTINQQIEIARAELQRLASKMEATSKERRNSEQPYKSNLRNLLRIADLYSSQKEYKLQRISKLFHQYESDYPEPYSPSEAEVKRAENRVSGLATDAFAYIYRGEYLDLLSLDSWPWDELQPQAKLSTELTPSP